MPCAGILGTPPHWERDNTKVTEQAQIDAIEKAITDAGENVDDTKAGGAEVTVDDLSPASWVAQGSTM